jgi:hypothetical protein
MRRESAGNFETLTMRINAPSPAPAGAPSPPKYWGRGNGKRQYFVCFLLFGLHPVKTKSRPLRAGFFMTGLVLLAIRRAGGAFWLIGNTRSFALPIA